MVNGERIVDVQVHAVTESVKLFIYATRRPIDRLLRDVDDIGSFDGPGAITPQLRLTLAAPPLLPASEAILNAVSRILGWRFFEAPYRLLLESMALIGPVAAAEAFILLMDESPMTSELQEIGIAFASVFERHADVFLARTRETLTPYCLNGDLSRDAAPLSVFMGRRAWHRSRAAGQRRGQGHRRRRTRKGRVRCRPDPH
jgi:hypothetical protein